MDSPQFSRTSPTCAQEDHVNHHLHPPPGHQALARPSRDLVGKSGLPRRGRLRGPPFKTAIFWPNIDFGAAVCEGPPPKLAPLGTPPPPPRYPPPTTTYTRPPGHQELACPSRDLVGKSGLLRRGRLRGPAWVSGDFVVRSGLFCRGR